MKVAFYSYPSAFQNPGGGEVQLLKTKEHLEKAGVEVKLFDQWNDSFESFDILHVFGSVKDCVGLMQTARGKGVRVALSPIFWSSFKRALHETGGFKKKAELTFRHAVKWLFPSLPSGRRKTMTLSDVILPNSLMEAEQVIRLFKLQPQKVMVVPNGVEARFKNADADEFFAKYGIKDFVLYAGRIEPRKNQLNFIRAMKGLDVPVVFMGEPVSDFADYCAKCREEASGNMHFIGRVEHDSSLLSSAYAACGAFALTSWFETPGLSALEAALSGAKIVITEEGSTREYFEDMAEYARPDERASIREAVEKAYAAPKDDRLKKHVEENYTWDKVAEKTLEAYRRILKDKG